MELLCSHHSQGAVMFQRLVGIGGRLNYHQTCLQTSLAFKMKSKQGSWIWLSSTDTLSPSLAKLQLQLTQMLGYLLVQPWLPRGDCYS